MTNELHATDPDMWPLCELCGTDHDGGMPGTLGGDLACLSARAAALGAYGIVDRVEMTRDYVGIAAANALGLPLYGSDVTTEGKR